MRTRPGGLPHARGTVTVSVTAAVALPLLPPAVQAGQPGSVQVASTAVQRVSMFTPTGGG